MWHFVLGFLQLHPEGLFNFFLLLQRPAVTLLLHCSHGPLESYLVYKLICLHGTLLTKKDTFVRPFLELTWLTWIADNANNSTFNLSYFCLHIQSSQNNTCSVSLLSSGCSELLISCLNDLRCRSHMLWKRPVAFLFVRLHGVISLQTMIRFCHCSANLNTLWCLSVIFFLFELVERRLCSSAATWSDLEAPGLLVAPVQRHSR